MSIAIKDKFGPHLITRDKGEKCRQIIIDNLEQGLDLDFAEVEHINHSFADEVFGKFVEEYSLDIFKEQIDINNLSETDIKLIRYVISQRLK